MFSALLDAASSSLSNIAQHAGHVKSSQTASFAGIPAPAHAASSYPTAAGPNPLQDVQQQLQEAARALSQIVNALPQGPQAFYQATESAAQSSQQSVQNALQQILQLQHQATAGGSAFQQQSQQPTASAFGPSPGTPAASRMAPAAGGNAFAAPTSAAAASPNALPGAMPSPKQGLEATAASQSLHAHEPAQAQPLGTPSGMPAHDPLRPTSVAEDEVDTVILGTNDADR